MRGVRLMWIGRAGEHFQLNNECLSSQSDYYARVMTLRWLYRCGEGNSWW